MLTIRKAQLDALAQHTLDRFTGDMELYVREVFPEKCGQMGDEKVREWIQAGVAEARKYGIEMHRDICRFIDLMFKFGRGFASDPALPWASRILNDPTIEDPITRMQQLYTEGCEARG